MKEADHTCPEHGFVGGLGKCQVDGCTYDARDEKPTEGGRALGTAEGGKEALADPLTLILPLPPSANRYWRHVEGRVLLSKDARKYRARCREVAVAQYGGDLIEERVRVHADVYMDLRGDLMNREKQLLDALEGAVIVNDKQVWDCRLVRHLDRQSPRVEITVTPIQEAT